MIELFQRICQERDIPSASLRVGDVATVVELLPGTTESGGEPGYALEVTNAVGETYAVVFVAASAVRKLTPHEILHARPLVQAIDA